MTMHPILPGVAPIYSCSPFVIINNISFPSQKCPNLDDKIYGGPTDLSPCNGILVEIGSQVQK